MSVCPVSPGLTTNAFTEYRSAGAVLCHSPRGDMHTDILWAAPSGKPGGAVPVSGPLAGGYKIVMTDDRISQRAAELLPEERAAGSADPEAQAAAILADSDEREDAPDPLEERRSDQTVTPGEATR